MELTKKNVWIINHYAGDTFFDKGGRHYWLAKFLKNSGYNPIIFCCNNKHNPGTEQWIPSNKLWIEKKAEEIDTPYIFIKARKYRGNGKQRVLNMLDFYLNVKKTAKIYALKNSRPDVIIASSVHPLALIAGIQLAKFYNVRCICEVRDLWPESLVAYGIIGEKSVITKLLYAGEKWIYKHADKIVMTWEGGYQYICDKGWDKVIPESKVVHISNGVDLAEYKKNICNYYYNDDRFTKCLQKRFVYTGSIRKVNNIAMLVEAAQYLKEWGVDDAKLFFFGGGDEKEKLEEIASKKNLDNVVFMGKVNKLEIPNILSQADINILHNSSTSLDKYGQSQNKLFEYLAAGKPILMTYRVGYSVISGKNCGVEVLEQNAHNIAKAIKEICEEPKERLEEYGENAIASAREYDFKKLTDKMITVIESM